MAQLLQAPSDSRKQHKKRYKAAKLAKAPPMLRETSQMQSARWAEALCKSWNDVRVRSCDEDCDKVEVRIDGTANHVISV